MWTAHTPKVVPACDFKARRPPCTVRKGAREAALALAIRYDRQDPLREFDIQWEPDIAFRYLVRSQHLP